MKPNRERSVLSSMTPGSASSSESDCGAAELDLIDAHRPVRGIPAPQELDPAVGQPVVHRAVDDAFQVARPRRAGIDTVVDVDPGLGRAVVGVHGQPVAAVPHRNALGAVQRRQVAVGHLPHHAVHLGAVERFDGGHPALVDQPVVVGQHRGPRIDRAGASPRHLPHAQVGPVREVAMTSLALHTFSQMWARRSLVALTGHSQIDQHHIQQADQRGDRPPEGRGHAVVRVVAHQAAVAGQPHQGDQAKGIPKDSTTCDNTSARLGSTPIARIASAGMRVTSRRSSNGYDRRSSPCMIIAPA